eukprot:4908608-Prymnesium_polylepis.2
MVGGCGNVEQLLGCTPMTSGWDTQAAHMQARWTQRRTDAHCTPRTHKLKKVAVEVYNYAGEEECGAVGLGPERDTRVCTYGFSVHVQSGRSAES